MEQIRKYFIDSLKILPTMALWINELQKNSDTFRLQFEEDRWSMYIYTNPNLFGMKITTLSSKIVLAIVTPSCSEFR